MSLIQLKDVYKIYAEGQENQVNALDGVTLSIDQGEFVAIIGTSGSGKSTMMNILGCLAHHLFLKTVVTHVEDADAGIERGVVFYIACYINLGPASFGFGKE